jgi:antitoxin CptB
MAPEKAAGEDLPMRRRRLRYRAWHRGTREMDMLLGPFADANADSLGGTELARFEMLLERADTDLTRWLMGQDPVPAEVDGALIARLRTYHSENR